MEKKRSYLGFIEEIMALTGTTKAELARRMGTSWQNINEKFNVGDVKISKAEEMLGAMGYTVRFVLDDGSGVVDDGPVQRNVGGLLLQINELMPDAGRLTPLKTFLRLHGKSLAQVARDIDVSSGSILKYFREDDTHISKLFDIAEAYGWSVMAKVEKKAQADVR